ncbi:putative organic cation transporter protein [Apostichopus japonicus]|uniref:Putative organic cation transporter protein n=1 Tax=Stichopus japonicus TaxID=307972 RepID=A0A2G8JI97_STIJA|nr:putative organic cation transporter protein [Apostichopus japonicus]
MDFQAVFTEIGKFGRYQKFILSVLSLPHLLAASYIYIQVLTIQDTEHHCKAWPNETCGGLNISETECGLLKRDLSIPFTQNNFGNVTEEDQCHKYNVTGISLATAYSSDDWINSTDIIGCDEGWVFNRTSSSSSIIIDFDLVCDKSYLAKLAQSAFFAGSLAGSFIAGAAADMIGRRRTQLLCYVTSAAVGVATAFSTSIWMYMILRFCSAMLLRGIGLADFVLINELVAPSKRVLVGNLLWVFWAFGYMIFAAIAKFLTNWRILEITISLPMMLALIVTYIFVPESPRWLITKRKPEKAAKILKKIAKVNGKIVSDEYIDGVCHVDECQSSDKVKGTFRDLIPVLLFY